MPRKTVFQRLTDVVIGTGNGTSSAPVNTTPVYNIDPVGNGSEVIASFSSKEERDNKLLQMKQQRLLAYQWGKIGYETATQQLAGANQVRVMYRDADLMDAWPEIGAALDAISEECTVINDKGKMLNIYSDSERVRAILEDLFVNRLDIHVLLPMIFRATAKYGNEFMFLNIDKDNGILGWRELPVHEMVRIENGLNNGYGGSTMYSSAMNLKPDEVKFVWEGHNQESPFMNWQVAHFRLIKDSLYLPYGVSYLNKARRHWRMLSMMEDAMLLYRLERSIERRIFKVNVGLIDDADIPAFLQQFMNNVKRAPIIDPQTGQMDLRKNFLDVSADYVIPIKNGQDPTTIETLQSAQNSTSMEDINYMQNKVLTALRIPKAYLNFQEAQGKGQNLSLLDIRFNRVINNIQQAILMELNKIAIIHLYVLGFRDEITNFTLSLNNPSNQVEMMVLENLNRRIGVASAALSEQGGGIPIMSWHKVQKDIMGLTDSEISNLLNEIRLEAALALELQNTPQIIKKTGLFDKVDRIYGEPGAQYSEQPQGGDEGGFGGGGGPTGGGGGLDFGGGFGDTLGDFGGEMGGGTDLSGSEGSEGLAEMGGGGSTGEETPAPLTESIDELKKNAAKKMFLEAYNYRNSRLNETARGNVNVIDSAFLINEELNSAIKGLEDEITENIDKNDNNNEEE